MKTAFLGQAYTSRSPILASQTAINIYPVLTETEGSEVGGFYGTPGLSAAYTASPIGEVRGLWVAGTGVPGSFYLFAVIGSTVYRFDKSYAATNLGTLPNSGGRVSMADNGTQLAIAHSGGMHYVALGGTAIAPVTNAPSNAILSFDDNYVLFTENSSGQFGITAAGDLSSINALDVATAEGWPDDCVSIICSQRKAYLLGTETIEIWYDTGNATFPFERIPGGLIEQGCCAKYSVAKLDNSIFWLGADKKGRGVVYRTLNDFPVRVSTQAVEFAINGGGVDITDSIGTAYEEDGHLFYMLTFPTLDQTWVLDISTGKLGSWHQRAYQDGQGILHRHRGNCYAQFYGDHLVGDYANGKIYKMNMNYTTDDGTAIYRERAWEIPDGEHHKTRIDKVEVVALTGDGDGSGGSPQMWLQVSKDAGRTWGFQRYQTLGAIGQRKARARWRRLGNGRDIVLRAATNMKQKVVWVDAFVDGETLDQ